jgi:hypothetical protein
VRQTVGDRGEFTRTEVKYLIIHAVFVAIVMFILDITVVRHSDAVKGSGRGVVMEMSRTRRWRLFVASPNDVLFTQQAGAFLSDDWVDA